MHCFDCNPDALALAFADVVNRNAGLKSPFKRFAARDMRSVFGIDLIRANIISPEAESFLLDHEVDLSWANANASTLPWSLYLAEPPVRQSLALLVCRVHSQLLPFLAD